jgi:hypothetical protein
MMRGSHVVIAGYGAIRKDHRRATIALFRQLSTDWSDGCIRRRNNSKRKEAPGDPCD